VKLLALAGDITALVAQIRVVTPLQALCERDGHTLVLRSFHDCTRADLAAADVLVVQRGLSQRAWRLQRWMRQGGGAVVYDIDDLLTELPAHISNQAAVAAQLQWLPRCVAASDALSVSTARLHSMLAETLALPPAVVVPNHALPPHGQALPLQHDGPVTLLFASTENVAVEAIFPALRVLQREQPDLHIAVVGPPGAAFEAAGLRVQRQALMPREAFLAFARGLPNPVGVVPLEDSRFAAGKSAVKWLYYAGAGLPTLCSAVSPYAELVDHGRTGWLVANTAEAWETALRSVIADAPWRQRVAAAASRQVAAQHGLQATLAAWQEVLALAVEQRRARALPPSGPVERLQDLLAWMSEGSLGRLRAFNRARLMKRQARKRAQQRSPRP
jgi:glycosyltransferase involved in cell wall biosynthesis